MEIIKAIILGAVEGLTEFLPVSSTGHLILMEEIFTLSGSASFRQTFMIVIQLPAIMAVALYFRKRLFPIHAPEEFRDTFVLWTKIVVAFLPAAVMGVLLDDIIEAWLFGSTPVAIALIVGGVVILAIERAHLTPHYEEAPCIPFKVALGIGAFQCLAMIPGTSRSAATIIGAMILGANRRAAAEFSFFLAIPTMLGATTYKLLKAGWSLDAREWALMGLGGLVSFITAYLVISAFMNYIRRRSFTPFGWYRIAVGTLILLLLFW